MNGGVRAEIGAAQVSERLLPWFETHGRHGLPWQNTGDPWRIWVSEIMLQQTQVQTVLRYYDPFVRRFPDVESFARASMDEALCMWSGLGYYARARNLKASAERIVRDFGGRIPCDLKTLTGLPGIGRSTAGAILSFAWRQAHPVLDANVKRVLARCFGLDMDSKGAERRLWEHAEACVPQSRADEYNQAIMDLGAMVCMPLHAKCGACPLRPGCRACAQGTQMRHVPKRKKKVLPVRQARYLLLQNPEGAVLMLQRPPSGVWGSLWCFPECPEEEEPQDWALRAWGLKIRNLRPFAMFRHTFSHFHLDIRAFHALADHDLTAAREFPPLIWHTAQAERGVPAPVQALLDEVWDTERHSQ